MGRQDLRTFLCQVAGDDTTVIQAVLACDIERSQLLKEEQTLLRQLNKEAPDSAQPSQAATANGDSATANGHLAPAGDKVGLPNGSAATAAETRDNDGAVSGKEMASKAADAAESKAAAQLAQVHILCVSNCRIIPLLAPVLHGCFMRASHAESIARVTALPYKVKQRVRDTTNDNPPAWPMLSVHNTLSFILRAIHE